MSARIANDTLENGRLSGQALFLLGIIGGLGWWSSQLVTAALVSSALLLALVLCRRVFTWTLLLGFAGFFLGGLPFWLYNALHGWPTFAFGGSLGQMDFLQGLGLFFGERFLALARLNDTHPVHAMVGTLVYISVVLTGIAMMLRAARQQDRRPWISLAAVFLFIAVSAAVFSSSHFAAIGDSRYLLPLVPGLAVLIGAVFSYCSSRPLPRLAAWTSLLVLTIPQLEAIPWASRIEQSQRGMQVNIEILGDYLEGRGVTSVYASNQKRSWNFALHERIVFSDIWNDFYRPNAQHVEFSDTVAIFENYGNVADFLNMTGGSAQKSIVAGFTVHHDFQPPDKQVIEIPLDTWKSATDSSGRNILETIALPVYRESWPSPRRPHEDWLDVSFHEPVTISKIRMLSFGFNFYPRFLQIEGKRPGDLEWSVLREASLPGYYYWSGNRPYPYGERYRLEASFEPVTLKKLRIVNKADIALRHDFRWSVQLLQLFGPASSYQASASPPQAPLTDSIKEKDILPDLIALLSERDIEFLYTDRWLANAIHQATKGDVWTPLEPGLFPGNVHPVFESAQAKYLYPLKPEEVMLFTPQTALLVRNENIPLVQRGLAHVGLEMRQTAIGPWTFFDFSREKPLGQELLVAGLRWTGFGCIPARLPSKPRRILPKEAKEVAFFHPDNNWTTGDTLFPGLAYQTTPEDRYLILRLKGPHPHGQDAASLGIQVWVNNSRLPLVQQKDFEFTYWLGWGVRRIDDLRILSRTFVPKELHINDDTRSLGLMVDSIWLSSELSGAGHSPEHMSDI
ncbi:hypothetical protein [Desulfonatronum thioautotrophicum]|uniref:hypothetical protein n=1 Tax=Desulfonatronum thioautotrophicum TaxID=617001 RepID=UPI0005EB5FA5|nr:hypothetical protein [Desulfonatronum thioautotrophicum]